MSYLDERETVFWGHCSDGRSSAGTRGKCREGRQGSSFWGVTEPSQQSWHLTWALRDVCQIENVSERETRMSEGMQASESTRDPAIKQSRGLGVACTLEDVDCPTLSIWVTFTIYFMSLPVKWGSFVGKIKYVKWNQASSRVPASAKLVNDLQQSCKRFHPDCITRWQLEGWQEKELHVSCNLNLVDYGHDSFQTDYLERLCRRSAWGASNGIRETIKKQFSQSRQGLVLDWAEVIAVVQGDTAG